MSTNGYRGNARHQIAATLACCVAFGCATQPAPVLPPARTGTTLDPSRIPTVNPPAGSHPVGTTVYPPSSCVGAVVNGVCNGQLMPDGGYHPVCYGTMLYGQCTGPQF